MISIFLSLWLISFSEKSVWCPLIGDAPKLDGALNDSVWQNAGRFEDFIEVFPNEGQIPKNRTICYIICDRENLYFGFECYNRDKIVANNTVRDKFSQDEKINILLSPNNDLNTGYALFVSPLNTQIDIRLLNNAEKMVDWDGVWQSEVKRTSNGWSCEIKIPFSLFKEGTGQKFWGIEIARETYIGDQQILIRWAKPTYELIRPSDFGRVYFYEEISFFGKPALIPYAVVQKNFSPDTISKTEYRIGGEIGFSPFAFSDFIVVINPDFSQIEADPEEIDLSKTIRRLPEKRNFFLSSYENIKIPIEIMYTRTIGDISYGGKMKLRAKTTSIEGWHVVTDSTLTGPRAKITNVACNSNFFQGSNFRLLFVNKHTLTSYHNNFSADLYQSLPKDFSLSGQFAFDWVGREYTKAYYLSVQRQILTGIGTSIYHKVVDSSFVAPLGYVPFKNMRETYGNIHWFNIINHKLVQRYGGGFSGLYRSSLHGDIICQSFMPSAEVIFVKPLSIRYSYNIEQRQFGIDLYDNRTNNLSFNIGPRRFGLTVGYFWGTYFGRHIDYLFLSIGNLNIVNRFFLELSGQSQHLKDNAEVTTENILNAKINCLVFKNIYLRNFIEYSDVSKSLKTNFLIDYNLTPGSHVYFILNEVRKNTETISVTAPIERKFLFKIVRYLSF